MRKLAWAALGFAAAAALAEYILPIQGLPYAAAALVLLAGAGWLLGKPALRARAAICLLAAALGLMGWLGSYRLHVEPAEELVAAHEGENVTIQAVAAGYPERREGYDRLEVRLDGQSGVRRALLYLYDGSLPDLAPGDVLQAEVRLSSALARHGERVHYHTSQGIYVLGYIQPDSLAVTGRAADAWRYLPLVLSQHIRDLCQRLFPADAAPFMKALLTGDTTDLEMDVRTYDAMRVAGVLHIVAVSGMHLFALLAFVRLLLGRGKKSSLVCLPLIWLFALMAGCRASILRAAVMQTLYLLAPLLRREPDGPTCLGAALLALLLPNPMAVGGVGLQLSFACTAGLVFLLPRMQAWMERRLPMHRWPVALAAGSLAGTAAALAFSTPLAAAYFGEIPLLSPIANLLTLPVITICFPFGYVCCALGAVWPLAGQAAARLLAWPMRWCLLVYRAIARVPFASLSAGSGKSVLWLAGLYVTVILWRALGKRRGRLRADIPAAVILSALALVFLAGKLAIRPGQALLTALDVGQGACTVLASQDAAVVVDCGSSSGEDAGERAAGYLHSIGKTRIDMLVLSHLHLDHAGGVETLLYRMPVDRLILPAQAEDPNGLLEPILRAAAARDTQVFFLTGDRRAQVGGVELALLLPLPESADANELGLVVLARAAGRQALIMGDAGLEAEDVLLRQRLVPDVDVLVAGHHGSRTASGPLFLHAAQAETAILSVGYNTYGHPSEETLARLEEYSSSVRRTDEEGNVTIKLTENGEGYGG